MANDKTPTGLELKLDNIQEKEQELLQLVQSTSERISRLRGRHRVWKTPTPEAKQDGSLPKNETTQVKKEDQDQENKGFQPSN